MSLKLRLIAVLCAFVVVALVASDALTYTSFRSYAISQLDQQLKESAPLVARDLGFANPFTGSNSEVNPAVASGTVATELSPGGQQLLGWTRFSTTSQSSPILPASLAKLAANSPNAPFVYETVQGTGSVSSFRVVEASLTNGNVLAEAIPLTSTDAALHHLLALELLVSGAVLIALALARVALHPAQPATPPADGGHCGGDRRRRLEPARRRRPTAARRWASSATPSTSCWVASSRPFARGRRQRRA